MAARTRKFCSRIQVTENYPTNKKGPVKNSTNSESQVLDIIIMDIHFNGHVIKSIKEILEGPHNERKKLKLLKKFEVDHGNGLGLNVLSCLIKTVPLTKSVEELRNLMMLFSRRLIQLLDEMEILQEQELAKKTLQLVKQFWSVCSNQQVVVIPSELCGQWTPQLIDIVTSLASVYIDLFIITHEHADNQNLCSKRLYSWLAFDLNPRALKTAFLEVSCPIKRASKLLSPVLRKVLPSSVKSESHLDYLLHMLLMKKWLSVFDEADIEVWRNTKAPKQFVPWLCRKWSQSHDYIPQDKSLKRRRVSQFLLDLDDEAIESLTDVYSESLTEAEDSGEANEALSVDAEGGEPSTSLFVLDKTGDVQPTKGSEALQVSSPSAGLEGKAGPSFEGLEGLFVLDKIGTDTPMQISDTEDDVQIVKRAETSKQQRQKRKREDSKTSLIALDAEDGGDCYIIPKRTSENEASPLKKRRKIGAAARGNDSTSDLTQGLKNSDGKENGQVFEISEDEDDIKIQGEEEEEDDNPLGLDVSDFEALVESDKESGEVIDVSNVKSGIRQSRKEKDVMSESHDNNDTISLTGGSDDSDDDVIDVDASGENKETKRRQSGDLKKKKNVEKSDRAKALTISDPVGSYFVPQKHDIQVFNLTEDWNEDRSGAIVERKTLRSKASLTDQTKKNHNELTRARSKASPVMVIENEGKDDFVSVEQIQESPVSMNSSDDEIVFKSDTNVQKLGSSMEDEISRQLSNIRKSVSASGKSQSVPDTSSTNTTPSRMTTRLRTRSGGDKGSHQASTLPQRHTVSERRLRGQKADNDTSVSASILKDWLKSSPKTMPRSGKRDSESFNETKSIPSPSKARKRSSVSESEVKSPVSPSKTARRNSDSEREVKSPLSPSKATKRNLSPEKEVRAKSPSKSPTKKRQELGKEAGSLKTNQNAGSNEMKQALGSSNSQSPSKSEKENKPLTKADIFPPTYSRISLRKISKCQSTAEAAKTSSPERCEPASESQSISYNLRTPKKSASVKSPHLMKDSTIDKFFPHLEKSPLGGKTQTPSKEEQTPSNKAQTPSNKAQTPAKVKTPAKEKTNKSDANSAKSVPTTPKTPTSARRKTVKTPSKTSPSPSTVNRRKSLRSCKAD